MPINRQQARPGHAVQQPRGIIAYFLLWIAWWIKACLDAWEETLNSLLREGLSITQRAINGASAWTLSGNTCCNDSSCTCDSKFLLLLAGHCQQQCCAPVSSSCTAATAAWPLLTAICLHTAVFTSTVFNRDYKAQLRGRWTVLQEQYSWWGRDTETRSSTLNAVLARKFSDGEGGLGDLWTLYWQVI